MWRFGENCFDAECLENCFFFRGFFVAITHLGYDVSITVSVIEILLLNFRNLLAKLCQIRRKLYFSWSSTTCARNRCPPDNMWVTLFDMLELANFQRRLECCQIYRSFWSSAGKQMAVNNYGRAGFASIHALFHVDLWKSIFGIAKNHSQNLFKLRNN